MESVKPPTVESEQPSGVVKRAITASPIGNAQSTTKFCAGRIQRDGMTRQPE
jgi:hypothetical protein